MTRKEALFQYLLRLADDALINGQRLSQWCGHGPILEQDMALTNMALDQIGRARSLYQYAGEVEGKSRSEDDLAYLRDVREYYNVLLVEQPNGHFGTTIMRQFFFDTFNYFFYQELQKSKDETLSAIAEKSIKEITYHLRWSAEWVVRLGDGTEVSHQKMQDALDELWIYTGELLKPDELDNQLLAEGIGVDLNKVGEQWRQKVKEVLERATLPLPDFNSWMQSGGRKGVHSEHLGYILSDLQFLQRAYPGQEW
ncbi:MAG: 1,2-phenylacetyl-CoA epoxidase subunit PaaC [Bacteroidota bacterium]